MTGLGCEFRSTYKCMRFMASSAVRNYVFCGRFGGFRRVAPEEFSRSQKRAIAKAARRFKPKS